MPLLVLVLVLTLLTLAFAFMGRMFGYFSRIVCFLSFCYLVSSTTLLIWMASYGEDVINK